MEAVFVAWGIAAAVLIGLAIGLGRVINRGWTGILIDERGRYSLTRMQLTLWSILVLSLICGVFVGRLKAVPSTALDFTIPGELLGVLGISAGSTALATAIKTTKDAANSGANIAASDATGDKPRLAQIFLVEEGEQADKIIDITKYQNFWFTIVLVAAYIALVIASFSHLADPSELDGLPGFGPSFIVLLAISHATYIAGKVPTKTGEPAGLTLNKRRLDAVAVPSVVPAAAAPAPGAVTYVARNP